MENAKPSPRYRGRLRPDRPAGRADKGAAARQSEDAADGFKLEDYLRERAALVESALNESLGRPFRPARRLFEAIRYSLLANGKRLRPILALAACEAVGGRVEAAIGLACAVEMIHTYSIVHDDLPCMDNDDLRRGRPTNHKVFGEALATLAGDALLTDAFGVLARSVEHGASPAAVLQTLAELAGAAGSSGMVAGQVLDILGERRRISLTELEDVHSRKTGALFVAAVRGGARLGGGSEAELKALAAYGRALGLAFQVIDDILDVEGSTEQMGKRTQKDERHGKNTYPSLLGLTRSRRLARGLESRARQAIAGFDKRAEPLRALASFAVERAL